MKIKIIVPITTREFEERVRIEVKELASKGTYIEAECLEHGTDSIESMYDEMLCAPGIIKLAEKAQDEGFEGVIINCMGDPALDAVRERLDIPVVGPGRTSMLYAADLAHRFSIVTVLENVVVIAEKLAAEAGLASKMASVRYIKIPVLKLKNKKLTAKALVGESLAAIEEDGAHAIVIGCTGMRSVAKDVAINLKEKGWRIPVIDPLAISVRHLETLISLRLMQSKRTYMAPQEKTRNILERI